MDFIDEVRQFATKAQAILVHLKTEEATKVSLVLPFIQMLGYNVFDPSEVVPEFAADVGTKKGEKVDYAIMINGKPAILVEVKGVNDLLTSHDTQLFRYFSVTPAKFAILTNGLIYKFYSDLQEPNKMDLEPFLEFSLTDIKESIIVDVKKFHRENFNADDLVSAASNLKHTTKIKAVLDSELKEPSEDFLRLWLKHAYPGKLTASALERLRPVVKKAMNQYISELINDRLKSALQNTLEQEKEETSAEPVKPETPGEEEARPKYVTTSEELEGFYIAKALLREVVDPTRISFKDTTSYLAILLDGNVRRWVCRLYLGGSKKYAVFPADDKSDNTIAINSIDDLFKLKNELTGAATRLVKQPK